MNEKAIIHKAMESVGWTQSTLAEKCGYNNQSSIASRIQEKKPGSLRVDIFVQFLDAMGYEVVVQSKNPRANMNRWVVDVPARKASGDE